MEFNCSRGSVNANAANEELAHLRKLSVAFTYLTSSFYLGNHRFGLWRVTSSVAG